MRFLLPSYGEVQRKPRKASGPQARFHRAARTHNYTMFLGGLGSGKSWAGAWEFLISILENRQALQASGQADVELTYLVGAPTYQLIDAGPWKHLLRILGLMAALNGFSLIKGKPHKSHPREITLITGDTITFIAVDALSYAASTDSGWWYDESEESKDPKAGYDLLNGRLRDERAPRLFGIVTSTPRDDGYGVADVFDEQLAKGDKRYAIVQAHTSSNPANEHNDYVARCSATMSEREKRVRLGGERLPPENTVYGLEFSPTESVARGWTWNGPRSDREYHIIVDWGGSFAGIVLEHDPTTKTDILFAEVIMDKVQDEEFLMALVKELERWGIPRDKVKTFWCDYNPQSSVRLAFSRPYWPGMVRAAVVHSREEKQEGINTVRWRLKPAVGPRKLLLAEHLQRGDRRGIWQSLLRYTRQTRVVGGVEVQLQDVSQESIFSHACDAVRYYCWQRYSHLRGVSAAPAPEGGQRRFAGR